MSEPADRFDLDPAIQADPFAHYERLREDAPVLAVRGRKGAPAYVLSGYDDVVAALRDPDTFSSEVAPAPILMFKDPPEHTRLRKTLQRAFTPRAIEALAPRVATIAATLIERFVEVGGGDFVDAFDPALDATGQLAFGWGIHVCLGAPLARLEGRIALRLLAQHAEALTIDPDRPPVPVTGGTTSEFGWRALWLRARRATNAQLSTI